MKINKIFNFLFIFVSLFIVLFFSQTTSAEASDRYWIGGTGNWSDMAHWSDADAGTGGFSVPTSFDNVYFSAGSFSVNENTVTLDMIANTAILDFAGIDQTVTFSSSVNSINIYGALNLPPTNLTWTFTGTAYVYLKATTSVNITMGTTTGRNFNQLYFDGVGGIWTNQDEMNIGSTTIRFQNGTWTTNNKNITFGGWIISVVDNGKTRVLNLGSSTINCGWNLGWGSIASGLIVNAGTSTINHTTGEFYGGYTYYNVILSGTTSTLYLYNNFTCNNLTYNKTTTNTWNPSLSNNMTINGIFTINGYNSTTYRAFFNSLSIGTQRTITVDPAKVIASNVDFRDIKFANAIDLSGITGLSGDAGGNSGITFTTAQPQYFKHTSGAVSWSNSAKWFSDQAKTIVGRVPLPQDNATFDAGSFTGTSTLTVDVPRIGRSLDMSGVSQAVTMTVSNNIDVYGDFVLYPNIAINTVGYKDINFLGRGNFNISTFNKSSNNSFRYFFNTVNGKYTLQSDFYFFENFNLGIGTLDFNDFNVTGGRFGYFSSFSGTTLYMGNGTTTIVRNYSAGAGFNLNSGCTLYSEGSILKFDLPASEGTNNGNFNGAGKTFNKVWISGTHTGLNVVNGSVTIAELIIDAGRKVSFAAGGIYNIAKMTAIGTALNPITISSITAATHTLNYTGATNVVADYLNLSYSTATPANKFFASHSTDGGNNNGWTFANAPDAPTSLIATPSSTQISLSWTAPANNGNAITDYVIEYKLTSEPTVWSIFADAVSTNTTASVIGLSNGSSYDFRVSSVNTIGQGLASSVATSMPYNPNDRYWVGGTGNWSDTAHWANVNGGAGGQTAPTSTNDVYFSASSVTIDGAIVTLDVVANTNSLDFSGLTKTMTMTSSVNALNVYGSFILSIKLLTSFSGTASLNFKATTNVDIRSNGNTSYWALITFNGSGGYWTLKDNWNCGNSWFNTSYGTLNTNSFNLTARAITTTSTNSFNYILGSSTLTLQLWYAYYAGTTLNAGTSTFIISSLWLPGDKTYYNVELDDVTQTSSAISVSRGTYNNLTVRRQYITGGNQTVNGLLTIKNTIDSKRPLIASRDIGTKYAFTSANNLIEATDFRDITGAGSANWDLSSITGGSGDAGGNSGITFTTAQPQYFKHTSGAVSWSNQAKWFSDQAKTITGRVPLPQDDATFDAESFTGTSTLTVDVPRIGRSLDMSGVSQAVTMTLANAVESYGSYILGNNITPTGNRILTLMGRSTFILNTFEKINYYININAPNSTYTNQSNIVLTSFFNVILGIFDINDYNFTAFSLQGGQGAGYGTLQTIYLGNGLITLTMNVVGSYSFIYPSTLYSENSTIKLYPASGSDNVIFIGGGKVYNKVWFSGSHTGNFDITGSNTFNEIIIDPGRKVRFTAGTTTNIGKFTAIGTLANPITISSITAATHTLNYTGATNVVADYLNLSYSTATPANKFFASHSTDGGNNSGWTFANAPDAPTAVGASGGNALANLTWSAPAWNGGTAITDYIIEYKLTSEPTVWTTFSDSVSTNAFGTVTGLSNGSSYDFRISAVNAMGQGSTSTTATATPITVPNAPTLVVATRGNAEASVAFTPPIFNGGSPITSYTVTSNPGSQIGTGSTSPIIVTGLSNGTAYIFSVTATNAAGTGPASTVSNSVTPATIPDAPTTPIAVAGNAQVSLSWTAPVWNGGSSVTDYVIEYKLSSEPTTWSLFADGVSANTNSIVTGLTNALSYDFRIYSVNDVGQGSQSVETNAMPVTVPDAPIAVSGIAGNAEVSISFTPPTFNGGSTINSYTVTSNPGNFTATGNSSPINVTGLTNGTQYTFTVTAINAIGESSPSNPSAPITPITVPDAPTTVTAVEGNRQATISFVAPTFDGGTPITNYTVTSSPEGMTATGNTSPIVVTGLSNGSTYTFTVKATNVVGDSASSSPSNSVKLSTEPSEPVNLASTVLGNSIGLTWSAPVSNGGSAITDYVIEYQLSTGGTWAVFAEGLNTATTATVIGLSNSTSYDFRVIAVNAIGQSTPSNTTTAIPGEPAQVIIQNFSDTTVSDIVTNIRITNEGTSEYEYQYTWCITSSAENLCGGGDDIWSATAAKLVGSGDNYDTPLTSTILIPGNYYFHIKVLYGSESSNAYQSFTALATYPNTPTSPTTVGGNASATVSFTPSTFDGGSPITSYTVTSNPGGITGSGTASPITVTGLTNGIEYNFNITATNIIGTSPASSYSNSVIPVSVPDAPTGVTAIAGDQQVILSWIAPVYYGGSVITDYIIEYKLTSAIDWSVFSDGISATQTATVTGLTNNQSYDFRISAVNAVGQSAVNGASTTLPKNKQGGSSSGSSAISIRQPIQPEIPTEVPGVKIKPETPTTEPITHLKPTKSPTKNIAKNTTNNTTIIVQDSNTQPNEITVTPTEKIPENKSNPINKILGIIGKIVLIVGGIIVVGGGLLLLIIKLLGKIKSRTKIIESELQPEIPSTPKPRRKI